MGKDIIVIHTFEELLEHEQEIVDRINAMPMGGNLFIAHPFMLLEELGIHLTDEVIEEIKDREPYLSALSPTSYYALKETKEDQRIRYHLRGLFRRTPEIRREEP